MPAIAITESVASTICHDLIGALIFGAKKFPELARSFGRASSEYEKAKNEAKNELERIKNPSSLTQQNDREKLEANADTLANDVARMFPDRLVIF